MARVTWTRRGLANLNAIFAYIHGENPAAAARVFLKLRRAADALDIQPNRGRPIGGGRRELTTVHPYLIRYRVTAEGVEILQVRHGARKPDAR